MAQANASLRRQWPQVRAETTAKRASGQQLMAHHWNIQTSTNSGDFDNGWQRHASNKSETLTAQKKAGQRCRRQAQRP